MSGFEKVKVLVEIIEDALVLEDKLRGYVNKNNQDNMEQDELEDSMIWNGIMQDCYIWDMIRSQTSEWCEESMEVYGDWPVVDRCQSVVWRDCSDYWQKYFEYGNQIFNVDLWYVHGVRNKDGLIFKKVLNVDF